MLDNQSWIFVIYRFLRLFSWLISIVLEKPKSAVQDCYLIPRWASKDEVETHLLDWELADSTRRHRASSTTLGNLITLWPAVSSQKRQSLNPTVSEVSSRPRPFPSTLIGMHLVGPLLQLPAELPMFALRSSSFPSALSHLPSPTVLAPSVVLRCPDSARMFLHRGLFYMRLSIA